MIWFLHVTACYLRTWNYFFFQVLTSNGIWRFSVTDNELNMLTTFIVFFGSCLQALIYLLFSVHWFYMRLNASLFSVISVKSRTSTRNKIEIQNLATQRSIIRSIEWKSISIGAELTCDWYTYSISVLWLSNRKLTWSRWPISSRRHKDKQDDKDVWPNIVEYHQEYLAVTQYLVLVRNMALPAWW